MSPDPTKKTRQRENGGTLGIMEYWAKVTEEGEHWLAEFPEAPGCQTFAESEAELPETAREALEGWLETQLQTRQVPPRPREHRGGGWLPIRIDARLAAKVGLRQARDAAGVTQSELARRIGVSQQSIAKLEDPDRNVELDTIVRAARALGYALELDVVPAGE
ncbi:MAG: helix-turn-helix domain-containing protein [Gemmatimonadaceae bacterium]